MKNILQKTISIFVLGLIFVVPNSASADIYSGYDSYAGNYDYYDSYAGNYNYNYDSYAGNYNYNYDSYAGNYDYYDSYAGNYNYNYDSYAGNYDYYNYDSYAGNYDYGYSSYAGNYDYNSYAGNYDYGYSYPSSPKYSDYDHYAGNYDYYDYSQDYAYNDYDYSGYNYPYDYNYDYGYNDYTYDYYDYSYDYSPKCKKDCVPITPPKCVKDCEPKKPVDDLKVICIASHRTVNKGDRVTFTADVVGGTRPYQYDWTGDADGSDREIRVRFDKEGRYTINLKVTDSKGRVDRDTCEVRVVDDKDRKINVTTGTLTTKAVPPGGMASVGSVYLNQVPYTGPEDVARGVAFVGILLAWSIAGALIARKRMIKNQASKRIADFKESNKLAKI